MQAMVTITSSQAAGVYDVSMGFVYAHDDVMCMAAAMA